MEDYLHEINTALESDRKSERFESIDEVTDALEERRRQHREKGLKYSGAALTILGTGFLGDSYSFLEDLSSDETGRVVLTGDIMASSIPTFLGYRQKNRIDEIDQVLNKIEREEYGEDLAYEIADIL